MAAPLAIVQEARICLLAGARIRDSADPTDAFLVLLSGPLSLLHGSLFDQFALSAKVKEQFGWSISSDALEYFIPKLRSLGWLKSQGNLPSQGPYVVDLPEPDFEGERGDPQESLAEVGTEFVAFAKSLSPINILPADPIEAGSVLLRYVVDSNAPIEGVVDPTRDETSYLSARFVEHVTRKKLPLRTTIDGLSALGFLFRVAEEIGQPSSKRKVNIKIIVDGPVVLDYLKCSGPSRFDAVEQLFVSLKKIGASIVTFSHCVDEAREALRSVLKASPRDRYGPTGEALRKGWVKEQILQGISQNFDVSVRAKGIEILPDDIKFMPQSHAHFDSDRARVIEESINWHDSDNETAIYRDADTTVLTIRRRASYRTTDLFDSRYVCITSNQTFASATARVLREMSYYNTRQIPPVVSLKELSAKLWLEVGNSESKDRFAIPRSQLIVACDRSLRFNQKVVERAKTELAKTRPEQLAQFELLLEVPRSARAVMDVALNNEKYVSGETIDQLVEAAVEAAGKEVAEKERAKRKSDEMRYRNQIASAEAQAAEAGKNHVNDLKEIERLTRDRERIDSDFLLGLMTDTENHCRRLTMVIRIAAIIIAIAPLILSVITYSYFDGRIAWILWSLLVSALGAASAMDRPGAWLTKLIHNQYRQALDSRLRRLGRHDLAELGELAWVNGSAVWQSNVER